MAGSAGGKSARQKVNWEMTRALLKSFLIMDFRNQQFGRMTNTSAKDPFSPMFWVTGQNLLISCFLTGLLYARVESYFFALAAMGAAMLIVMTSIIVEFNEIVLDPHDLDVIGHHPLNVKTYAAARIANLLMYVVYVIASLTIVPAIVGVGMLETTGWFMPLFLLASFLGCMIAAALVILFYLLFFGGRPSRQVQEVLAWTQAAMMFITFYGGQAVLRDANDRFEMVAYHMPAWMRWTPPGLLAEFVVSSNDGFAAITWWWILIAFAAMVVVWLLVFQLLARMYARLEPLQHAAANLSARPLPQPGQLFGWLCRSIGANPDQRMGFWLCSLMLRRDISVRMRAWPTLGATAVFLGLGLFTNELADPLLERGRGAAISLAAIYSLAFPLPTILYNLRFSRDYRASWIFAVAPIASPRRFIGGIEKALLLKIMLPMLVILTGIFLFQWKNPLHALLHVYCAVLIVLISSWTGAAMVMTRLPFSAPLGRGESIGSIAPLAAVLSSIAAVLGGLHYVASADIRWFMGFIGVLSVATFAAFVWSQRVLENRKSLQPAYE